MTISLDRTALERLAAVVQEVDHPAIRLQLDVGAMAANWARMPSKFMPG